MFSALSFPFIYTRPNRELSLSLFSLISCTFLSQLIIKKKADPRWCWWLTCQSINQSINKTNHQQKFKKQVESKYVLLFYLVFGPPSSFRAALLCPLQHLRHCPRGIIFHFITILSCTYIFYMYIFCFPEILSRVPFSFFSPFLFL